MDFSLEHSFSAPPEAVAEAMLDEDFQGSLGDVKALAAREVLSQKERPDGRVVRRTRCLLAIDLGAVKRFVGDGEPAWVEVATWEPVQQVWEWVIEPEIAKDLLAARGRIAIDGSDDRTTRTITGHVQVRVPLYGARVEGWIVDGLRDAYDEEAERLASWLQRGSRSRP